MLEHIIQQQQGNNVTGFAQNAEENDANAQCIQQLQELMDSNNLPE